MVKRKLKEADCKICKFNIPKVLTDCQIASLLIDDKCYDYKKKRKKKQKSI